jgi:penicillin-binding protein 1A
MRPSTLRQLLRAAPGLLRSRLEALWRLAVASPANKVRAVIAVAVGVPLACAVLAIGAFYLAVTVFAPKAAVPSPSAGSLAETIIVYAADGSVIASLHAGHDRDIIDFTAMPQHLRDAVVAAEDSAFYSHSGLELRAIVRAAGANLRAGGTVQGGSTITQQYVKNAYVGSDRTVVRKLREARMAAQLEHHWSKDRILEAYLNTIYLGAGAYGVEAAAHRYFAKPASDLSLSESALLAGLIPAPERWSPFADEGGAELRRRYVIDRMQALGFVDAATAAEARLDRPLVTEPELTALRYPWSSTPCAATSSRSTGRGRSTPADCACTPASTRRCRRLPSR